MTLYYYAIFAVFAIVAYMIIVDKNVAIFIDLMIRYAGVQLKRFWWIIRFHPDNKISIWLMNRRIERMTKKLRQELKLEDDTEV